MTRLRVRCGPPNSPCTGLSLPNALLTARLPSGLANNSPGALVRSDWPSDSYWHVPLPHLSTLTVPLAA
jgi:hypothetical protein